MAVVLPGLLVPDVLAAGPSPDPDLSIENTHRAGPFHVRPFIRLKDVGYDDNVRFDSPERDGDTTATAGAGLRSVMLWRDRGGLHLSQEFDYVAFGENSDLNHWNGALRARGIFLLKRVALSLEDRFDSRRERPNTEIDRRLRLENNVIAASARTLGTGRLAIEAAARHEAIDYSSDAPGSEFEIRRLRRDVNAFRLAADVRILPKTTLTIEGDAERIDFIDDAEGRDSRTVSFIPGLRFDPSASVQGFFRLGVKSLEARDRPADDVDATVGEAALSLRLGGRARVKGTFSRDLVFSTLQENLYYISSVWSASYEHFLTRRLQGEIRYGRGLNDYPNEVSRGGPAPFQGSREDRFTRYGLQIRYRISDQIALVVAGSRLVRDSTDDFFDRTRNLYTFGSTYEF